MLSLFMIKFCQNCGNPTYKTIPDLDHQLRDVCTVCGFIHYQNPKVVAGALIIHEDKVLLCRRAIEPCYGRWTIPAGYMEIGETIEQGAMRECWEEAEAKIQIEQLYCTYDIPYVGHIYMLFKSQLQGTHFGIGEESLECALFAEHEIPWHDLAFLTVERTLRHYFADRKQNVFPAHLETLTMECSQQFYMQLSPSSYDPKHAKNYHLLDKF